MLLWLPFLVAVVVAAWADLLDGLGVACLCLCMCLCLCLSCFFSVLSRVAVALAGMENPNLTFVTPTLIAGDRSLADVVIHEVAHSWTGNLVTNVNWQHFWLNEGATMFLQRKIMSASHVRCREHSCQSSPPRLQTSHWSCCVAWCVSFDVSPCSTTPPVHFFFCLALFSATAGRGCGTDTHGGGIPFLEGGGSHVSRPRQGQTDRPGARLGRREPG